MSDNADPDLTQPVEGTGDTETVLLDLEDNRRPAGARVGFLQTSDNVRLRYGLWDKARGAQKGTICLVQGRTEYIEKYYETIEEFRARGFGVASFDWRGQGGSERLIKNGTLGYVDSFADYVTDLKDFHSQILLPECTPPFYLVGHSMGGLVALMAAAEDPLMFDRVFLSAPMLAIPGLSSQGMARFSEILSFLGLGRLSLARKADRPPSGERFAGNPLTSDFARYMRVVHAYEARPDLTIASPTMRWSAAAFRAMVRAEDPSFALRMRVPVLMLAAARDEVVSTPAIERLGLSMRTGRHLVIPAARHELFQENDDIRAQVLAAFDAFITEQSE